MKKQIFSFCLALVFISSCLHGQVYPLSENSWSNPEFVDRFLGSYGFLSGKEPEITSEESKIFQTISELIGKNDINGAIQEIRSNMAPDSSAALDYTLGNLLLQQSKYEEGLRAYEAAIRKFPDFLRAYKNAGLAYIQMQNYNKGAEFLIKSIELGNQEGNTLGLLGYCYLNMGNAEAALDAYRMATVLAPNNKDWQVGKATALQQVGLYTEAIAKFDELIAKDPDNRAYYNAAANACIAAGEEMKAAKYLEVLSRRGLADSQARLLLGDIYLNQQMFVLAKETYSDTLQKLRSGDVDRVLRFLKGLIVFGVYDEATALMAEVESSSMNLSNANKQKLLNMKAEIALAQGKSDEAVSTLEDLIKMDPTNGDALLLLGEYYFSSNDYETAVFYFERAQKLSDTDAQVNAYIQEARVMVARRKFDEAIDLLQKAQGIKYQSHVQEYLKAIQDALKATF